LADVSDLGSKGGSKPMQVAVTTTRQPKQVDIRRAERYALALATSYIPRRDNSLIKVMHTAEEELNQPVEGVLVVRWPELSIWTPQGTLQYHPNMALHRVAALRRGEPDVMVQVMELRPNDKVLDCTAGLASDAVVASHAVGEAGQVVCLESEAPLALLLKVGLRHYPGQGVTLTQAMRRVRVRHVDYNNALQTYAPASFDVVYFDPMFASPVEASRGIAPLRPLANHAPLTASAIAQASVVARRLVVAKDQRNGPLHSLLDWDEIRGGRNSGITYLIKRVGDRE
jgi:16S rRNA (guanine1516-N2)-methyltransferase